MEQQYYLCVLCACTSSWFKVTFNPVEIKVSYEANGGTGTAMEASTGYADT